MTTRMTFPDSSSKVTWNPPPVDRMLGIVKSGWKGIIAGGVLGFAIALGALAIATPRYSISASVMLQLGREMGAPATLNGSIAMPAEKRPEDIATAVEMMSGQHVVEKVVDSFGEDFFYSRTPPITTMQKIKRFATDSLQSLTQTASTAFASITSKRQLTKLEKVVVGMQKDLTIEPARRSDVVNITMTSTDPDKGKLLLDKFIDVYRQEHLQAYQTPQAREFFQQEHDRIGMQLTSAEADIVKFKARHQVYSGDDQRKLLLEQQGALQTSFETMQVDVARVTAELADLQKSIDGLPAEVSLQSVRQRDPLVDTLRGKLAEAEANLAKVKSRYTDDSRPVEDATAEVKQLRDQLEQPGREPFVTYSVTSGASDMRKALQGDFLKEQSELDGLKAEADLKQSQIADISKRLAEVDAADSENVHKTRDEQILEQSYKLYAKNLEDARISEAMDTASISNIAVIEPPTASLVPTYPPTTLWLAAGVVLGAVTPFAFAFMRESLRSLPGKQSDDGPDDRH